jgi:hypothetical protein
MWAVMPVDGRKINEDGRCEGEGPSRDRNRDRGTARKRQRLPGTIDTTVKDRALGPDMNPAEGTANFVKESESYQQSESMKPKATV